MRARVIRNFRELYQYRALLWALTDRELRARYRASVIGFLWTFLNPTISMVVYTFVFSVMMKAPIERFPFYLFAGLLPWTFFASAVGAGTSAVSDRRDLLTKVRFPAQVLPATVVTTNLVNFVLSLPLLVLFGLASGVVPSWHLIFAVPVALVQTLFTLGIVYLLSAGNVGFRDLQHIVGNVLQVLFFMTPIVWVPRETHGEIASVALALNPLVALTDAWRAIFFFQKVPNFQALSMVALLAVALLFLASSVFERRREDFAELV